VSVSFLAHVPYTDMGQPIEGLLVAGGIAFGELLGLTLEAQRAQVQVEVEREAQRVLNHTAKRLMCNTAQAAQLVLSQLDDLASDDPVVRNTARSESEEVLRSYGHRRVDVSRVARYHTSSKSDGTPCLCGVESGGGLCPVRHGLHFESGF
jgi:hypothetical protein